MRLRACICSGFTVVCMIIGGGSLPASSFLPEDQYSIGSPTDEEQYFVELINRARADANAEAFRLANTTDPDVQGAITFFGVSLTEMYNQFDTLDQNLPPLSINAALASAARLHAEDMFTNLFQGHISSSDPPPPFSPGDTLSLRVAEFGYNYSTLSENVFDKAKSAFYGHAGFEIDWGYGPFGMQDPPGHREAIHSPNNREIGVGVVLGTNTNGTYSVGPLVVTQVFGSQLVPDPFITGVAYYDLNGNNFYDPGEGLGGLTVGVAETTDWAKTANSGGFSIPVPGNGSYTLTFSGLGLTPQTTYPLVGSGANVKQDLVLAYTAPAITGPATPATGIENAYLITTVPGASAYKVNVFTSDNSPWVEGAENGSADLTIYQSSVYEVIQSERVASGSFAFHLAQAEQSSVEIIQLDRVILPSASSEIQFSSRLQYATNFQRAMVDVSTDGGSTWINLYSQNGSNSGGEANYTLRSIPLGAYENIPVSIRFRYMFVGTGYDPFYQGTSIIFGWLIDDITVSDAKRISSVSLTEYPSTTFTFNPSTEGEYVLAARPINNGRIFPYGLSSTVTAGTGTATPLDLWRQAHFSPADLADPSKEATLWGNDADPELDGYNNLMEFALNGDPNVPDAGAIAPVFSRNGATLKLAYTMHRGDVTYRVLTNTVLDEGGWTTTGVSQTPNPDTASEGTPIEATATLDGQKRFLQLEVTLP